MRIANRPVLSRTVHALVLSAAASLALLLMLVAGSDTIVQARTPDTPTPEATQGPGDWDGVENLPPIEGERNPPTYPNMDSNLNRIVEQVQTGQFTAQAAAANAPLSSDESVAVTIYVTEGFAAAIVAFLESNGASPRNVGTDYVEAYVPVSLLPDTSEQEGVISIRSIIPPQPAQSTIGSEAATVHGATAWHSAGVKGQGVRIGIIDTGFSGYRGLMGSELPSSVEARCYTDVDIFTANLTDCETGDDLHGTAVTEAAFDISPEATYYIANPFSEGDLANVVAWMIDHDVDIINHSVHWIWSGAGDGTSPYSNSALRTVDAAVAAGITWVNAAGNSATETWFGDFSDSDGDGFHNFTENDGCNTFDVEEDLYIWAFLRWDDAWQGSTEDLDLQLYRVFPFTGTLLRIPAILTGGATIQDGESGDIPFEEVYYEISSAGTYCLAVGNYSDTSPGWIQLQTWSPHKFEHYTLHHSIGEPADSANLGLVAVGAADTLDTSTIEEFSSQGPTPDDRVKPDIVGADKVHSAAFGELFSGTSQASPYVAGLAALVKQRFPDYAPQQVANYLKTHAGARGSVPNNTWGYGFAKLVASDAATPTPEPTPTQGSCLSGTAVLGGDENPGLVSDCETLLVVESTLAGSGGLNWSTDIPIEDWDGVVVDGTPRRITRLNLHTREFTGTIPAELANLSELTYMNLSHNRLTGRVPLELGNLSNLSVLYLSVNQLNGSIPSELGDLSNLTQLWLSENQLSGEIPAELGALTNLQLLFLWHNQLSGEIPSVLGNLSELRHLNLSKNQLTGEIPAELGNLSELLSLHLNENRLTGEIPAELGNLSSLESLRLRNNQLTGCVPDSLRDMPDNDYAELGLPFCGDVEEPTPVPTITPTPTPTVVPTPEPSPTDPCLESLTDSSPVTGFWAGDCVSLHPERDGSYARFYAFELLEGSDLVVTLESTVDTYLYLREGIGKDGPIVDENDDDNDNNFDLSSSTDSGILASLDAGSYTIEATTYAAEEGGEFTLVVQGLPPTDTPVPTPTPTVVPTPEPSPTDPCLESLTDSSPVTGFWAGDCVSLHPERDGSYARFYAFELLEGSDLVVTLESTVDTYLYLREGIGKDGPIVDENDDDNDNNFDLSSSTDSGILASLDAGSYTIEATTFAAEEGGEFTLVVQGLPPTDTPVPTPTPTVVPITPIPTPTPVSESRWGGVSIGADHACAIFGGTTIECWGTSDFVRSTGYVSIAGRYVAVSSGANHTCGLVENGLINCWGVNNYGQSNAPAVSASTRYTAVSSGANHTCALVADGSINCWGANQVGQATPPTSGVFTAIHSGYDSSCALRSDGEYVCWGAVERNPAPSPIPTPVPSPTPQPIHTPDTDRAALVALYDATGGTNWTNSSNWKSDSHLSQWHGVRTDVSGRVITLILEDNGLRGSLPEELGNLTQLQGLQLGFNGLTGALPPQLSNLTNLHTITLNGNRLSETIPRELGRLRNLRLLDFGSNDLTGVIPRELGNLDRLGKLSFGSNRLEGGIPDELGSLVQLQYLVLSNNKLSGEIPKALGDLVNLIDLSVDTNQLTGQVPPEIGNLTQLQRLWIQRNQLTGQVPQTLTALTGLRSFLFDTNDGLCAPTDREFQEWLQSIEKVEGSDCFDETEFGRTVFTGGVDLEVTYIERLPRFQRYKLAYFHGGDCGPYPHDEFLGAVVCPEQSGLKRWPDVGETVELIAHAWNFGDTASGPFDYRWSIDDEAVADGRHPGLASGRKAEIPMSMRWPGNDSNPVVTFSIDPENNVEELLENNNSLVDWIKGHTIGFYFNPPAYESLTFSNEPGQTIQSPEHWVHSNIYRLNELLAEAGVDDRVRTELFLVSDDRHLSSNHELRYYMDGWWPILDNFGIYSVEGYEGRPEIDYGLLHEVMHQLGVIDIYQMDLGLVNVFLPDANRPGQMAGCGTDYWNAFYECYRFTEDGIGDLMAYLNHWIGPHTAGGLRSNTGHRRGFFGEYLYDTPRNTSVRVLDSDGRPFPDIALRFYQKEVRGTGDALDAVPEFQVTTDDTGVAALPNRGITGIVTATGHQLRPNPFGEIDVVGRNGIFIIEMEGPLCTNYEWLTLVDLNLAYWNGRTGEATFERTFSCPPAVIAGGSDSETGVSSSSAPSEDVRSPLPPPYIPEGLDAPGSGPR